MTDTFGTDDRLKDAYIQWLQGGDWTHFFTLVFNEKSLSKRPSIQIPNSIESRIYFMPLSVFVVIYGKV